MANSPLNMRFSRQYDENSNTTVVDVAAWTQSAIQAMNGLSLHADPTVPRPSGIPVTLQVPLDDQATAAGNDEGITSSGAVRSAYVLRRKTSERDTLRRRDLILKGKEGSRRRHRWENGTELPQVDIEHRILMKIIDRLIGNPHAEPPLPADWEVRPTHPVHSVPYFLAPLWDAKYAKESAQRNEKLRSKSKKSAEGPVGVGRVPKELKEKLKRAKGAKSLLQDLEHEIRNFVQDWESKEQERMEAEKLPDPDSDEDDLVFVGRNGRMHDELPEPPSPRMSEEEFLEREKLVFDAYEDDSGASFGRWLVHSIGQYYGLETWSVTVGKPARREAYVGIKEVQLKMGRKKSSGGELPRPLWAMV